MRVLSSYKYKDLNILRKKSENIKEIDDNIKKLIAEMYDTMLEEGGIGISAIQVGVPLKLVVTDYYDNEKPMVWINAEIIWASENKVNSKEGCLSIKGFYYTIKRYSEIKVKFLDIDNKVKIAHLSGIAAYCLQHEIDHTNGILFNDHLNALGKEKFKKHKKEK